MKRFLLDPCRALLTVLFFPLPLFAGVVIKEGESWRYYKGMSTPPVQGPLNWTSPGYDDSSWGGPAPSGFGYGDADDATVFGDMQFTYVSVFLRTSFVIADTSTVTHLTMAADYDDGFVAYINGVEAARRNMPAGPVSHTTTASGNHEASRGAGADTPIEKEFIALDPGLLVNGSNVIAVSGHNISTSSSDFSMIVEVYTNVSLVRGPFIQMPDPDAMTVVWRTDAVTDGVVEYGLDTAYGEGAITNPVLSREHVVSIPDLQPGTDCFYRVRSGGAMLSEGQFFRTPRREDQSFRFVVLGDFGQGTAEMSNIAARINLTDFDLFLTVGDNIYGLVGANVDGAPGHYDPFWFDLYAPSMRRVPTMPALGNHDIDTANGQWYLDYFHLPTNGPAAYRERNYSFNYGNAHFAVVDSNPFADNDAAAFNPIKNWLAADLAAATSAWKFVFLHHPPYTSVGSHGDNEQVKTNLMPIIEASGVHMLFDGHNHFYERINPINGVNHLIGGGGGATLYGVGTRKEYSAALVDNEHSFTLVEINGLDLHVEELDVNGQPLDTFDLDIGHPFGMDGLLDDAGWWRTTNALNTIKLYAAIRSNLLYVAAQNAPPPANGNNDHFIYINDRLATNRPANWAKNGTVMQWGAFLGDESVNGFINWFGDSQQILSDPLYYRATSSGLFENGTNKNGVMEGTINLAAHFGAFPPALALGFGPFTTADGGSLLPDYQMPPGNGTININSNEYLFVTSRVLALDLPVARAASNQTAEAGMSIGLDGTASEAPSGFPLSFAWQQLDGPGGVLDGTSNPVSLFRLTGNVPDATGVVIQLTVNDTRFDSNEVIALTFFPMLDTDSDGLSDQEEQTGLDNALTAPDPAGHLTLAANPDSDNDDLSDGGEAIAGTNPTNNLSRFEFKEMARGDGEAVVLRWESFTGRTYQLSRATNLMDGYSLFLPGLPAQPPENVVTDAAPGAATVFYELDVSK